MTSMTTWSPRSATWTRTTLSSGEYLIAVLEQIHEHVVHGVGRGPEHDRCVRKLQLDADRPLPRGPLECLEARSAELADVDVEGLPIELRRFGLTEDSLGIVAGPPLGWIVAGPPLG